MPTEPWLNGFLLGILFGGMVPLVACRWWVSDSHKRSMESYDRALDLLSDRFELFRDLHGAMVAEGRPSTQKEEG